MGARIVVTGLFALVGCSGGKAPPEVVANPPPPEVPPPPAPPAPPVGNPPGPRRLNPVDAAGRAIHRRPDGVCYVYLPMPPAGPGPTPSFQPPPTEAVDCPPAMSDPAWADCAYGEIDRMPDPSGSCVCHVMGNPPPPPRAIACPSEGP